MEKASGSHYTGILCKYFILNHSWWDRSQVNLYWLLYISCVVSCHSHIGGVRKEQNLVYSFICSGKPQYSIVWLIKRTQLTLTTRRVWFGYYWIGCCFFYPPQTPLTEIITPFLKNFLRICFYMHMGNVFIFWSLMNLRPSDDAICVSVFCVLCILITKLSSVGKETEIRDECSSCYFDLQM